MPPDEQTKPTPPPVRRRPVTFRPRTTLMVLYLFGFFVLFAFLMVAPALIEGAQELGPGPAELTEEERERAAQIGYEAFRGKFYWAVLASVLCVAAGAWTQRLPGLRER